MIILFSTINYLTTNHKNKQTVDGQTNFCPHVDSMEVLYHALFSRSLDTVGKKTKTMDV